MSKLKETLLMMAEQKETFKIEDKTFQIIEVKEAEKPKVKPHPNALTFDELEDGKSYLLAKKDGYMSPTNKRFVSCGFYYLCDECFDFFLDETTDGDCFSHRVGSEDFRNEYFTKYVHKAEQPHPDYSHLVGKWVKCLHIGFSKSFTVDKWYKCVEIDEDLAPKFIDDSGVVNGFMLSSTPTFFDLTNPQDTNPDEVKKILVPSEIEIYGWNDGLLSIGFGNYQSLLSPNHLKQDYVVGGCDGHLPIQCELIKCERAELKKGDVAFRTGQDSVEHFLMDICSYCIIINETDYCFSPNNEDVITDKTNWKHWYKLQPIQ